MIALVELSSQRSRDDAIRTSRHRIIPVLAVGVCTAGLLMGLPGLVMPSQAKTQAGDAGATPIVVTITDTKLTLSPSTAPVGIVIFRVVNRGRAPHEFRIAGNHTPKIAAGKTAMLKVAFTKRRGYPYGSESHGAGMSGFLSVIAPCTNPTTSTIDVSFTSGPSSGTITMPHKIPCGTVTFLVRNTDPALQRHDLNLDLSDQGGPKRLILGPSLAPGQTTKMTVNFRLKGNVYYFCNEPEHTEYGEFGYLVIT